MTRKKSEKSSTYEAIAAIANANKSYVVNADGVDYELFRPTLKKSAELESILTEETLAAADKGNVGAGHKVMAAITWACLPDDCTMDMALTLVLETGSQNSPVYWKAHDLVGLDRRNVPEEILEKFKSSQDL